MLECNRLLVPGGSPGLDDHGLTPVIGAAVADRCVLPTTSEKEAVDNQDDAEEEASTGISVAACSEMVERIRDGERVALEELYGIFARGVRFYLCRHLGPRDLEDRIHDTFLIVVQAIRRGDLREPGRLLGFIRTVVRRQVATYIDQSVQDRRDQAELDVTVPRVEDHRASPEEKAIESQQARVVRTLLEELPERDREVLRRFYILEQSQEQICRDMQLTETQYRLMKSRAKNRLVELGRKRVVAPNIVDREILRKKAAGAH